MDIETRSGMYDLAAAVLGHSPETWLDEFTSLDITEMLQAEYGIPDIETFEKLALRLAGFTPVVVSDIAKGKVHVYGRADPQDASRVKVMVVAEHDWNDPTIHFEDSATRN